MILDDAVVNEDVDMDDIDTSGLKKRIRKRIYRIIRIMNSHYLQQPKLTLIGIIVTLRRHCWNYGVH